MRTIWARSVSAHALGAHNKAASTIDGAAGDVTARHLFDGERLAGHHGFVHRTAPFEQAPIHRDFFAGPHAQAIPGCTWSRETSSSVPSSWRRRAVFGAKPRSANRTAGLAAGTEFEDLAQEHEGRDNGRHSK